MFAYLLPFLRQSSSGRRYGGARNDGFLLSSSAGMADYREWKAARLNLDEALAARRRFRSEWSLKASSPLVVSTDKPDYSPGQVVTISASGFKVGAAIRFSLKDLVSDPGDDGDVDDYGSFVVVDGGLNDLDGVANGAIVTHWTVPSTNNGSPSTTPDALNATLRLTAQAVKAGRDGVFGTLDDRAVGPLASHIFTDSAPTTPTTVAITAISPDNGFAGNDFLTNATSFTVSGTNTALGTDEKIQISSDGSNWFDVNQDAAEAWSFIDTTVHSSDFTYQVRVIDTANADAVINTNSQQVLIDLSAPTLLISTDKSALKAGETALITFTFSEDPGDSFTWDGSSGDVLVSGGSLSAITGTGVTRTATFTPTSATNGGSASITVAADSYTDAAGNNGGAGSSPSISFDTQAPSLLISSDKSALKAGETALITFTFSEDPGDSFTWNGSSGDVIVSGGSLSAIAGTGLTRTATFTPTSATNGGSASITVAADSYTDAAGNNGGAGSSPSISFDTQAPSLLISSDKSTLKAGETALITFTFSEDPGDSFTWDGSSGDVLVSGGSLSAITGTGVTRTATFTPTSATNGGSASITVAADSYTDAAGNNGGAGSSPSISFDTQAPSLLISSDKSTLKAGETALITFTFSEDPGDSFTWDGSSGDVNVSGGSLSAITGTGVTRTATFTPTSATNGGSASITVAADSYTDAAGNNGGAGSSPSLSFDTQAPSLLISSDKSALKVGETALITFTFSEDPGDSFSWNGSSGDVIVSGGSLSAITGTGVTRTATFTPTSATNGGSASITVAADSYTDAAGNNGGAGSSPSLSFDTQAPSLLISSDKSTLKAGETALITFTFSENPGDSFTWDGSSGDVIVSGGSLSAITGTGVTRTATFTPTSATNGGSASITVAADSYTDAAGNNGGAGSSPSISFDTQAPSLLISSDKSTLKAGETALITFTFSEDPGDSFSWDGSSGDVNVSGGSLSAITGTGVTRTATFTPTSATNGGSASITVAADSYTDAAGNNGGAGSSPSLSFDTQAPSLLISSDKSTLKAGETALITFTFSEDPGDSFTWDGSSGDVNVSGGSLSAITGTGVTRTATFTPTSATNSGSASITVAADSYTDAAGNNGGAGSSPSISFDTQAPSLLISSDKSALKAGETALITFTFSEDPGDSFTWDGSSGDVNVSGGSLSAITGTGVTRTATFTPTSATNGGSASITVAADSYTDAAGNNGGAGSSPSLSFDTQAPTTAINAVAFSSDLGFSSTDLVTAVASQTISGTLDAPLQAGETVSISLDNGNSWQAANASVGSTAWSLPTTTLSGSNTLKARVSDAAGNVGPVFSKAYAIDLSAPTLLISSDKSALKAGETALITFTFSEDPGDSFTWDGSSGDVNVSGGSLSAITGTGVTRTATFTPTSATNGGSASITVAADSYTDAAGNNGGAGSSPSLSFDTQAPSLLISSDKSTLKVGETALITFTFSEDPGDSFSWNGSSGDVIVSGGSLSAIAGTGVTRTATFTPSAATNGGSASITVAADSYTDAAGNNGGAGSSPSISFDTQAPTTAINAVAFSSDLGFSSTDLVTAVASQTISGTLDAPLQAGETVSISLDNGNSWQAANASVGSTAWSLPTTTLSGSNTLKARVSDAAGNVGPVFSKAYAIDLSAPTLLISSDKSALKAGETALITFTFSEDPGDSFSWDGSSGDVNVSGGSLSAITGTGVTRTATFTPTSATNGGSASITVAADSYTDAAGNNGGTGSSPSISFDTQAPTTAINAVAFSSDTGVSSTDLLTAVASQTISGTLDAPLQAGETVSISLDNGNSWQAANASVGSTSWNLPTTTLSGSNTLKARVSDAAGNIGPVFSKAYAIDLSAPTLLISSDKSTLKVGETALITFTFSEDPGDTFSWDGITGDVIVSGGSLSAIAGTGLTRTATFTPTPSTNGGSASITVAAGRYTDAAGNNGGAGSSPSISFDTQAPTTAINAVVFSSDDGLQNNDLITTVASQTISGSLDAALQEGETVSISLNNGNSWQTASATVGSTAWSLATTTLSGSNTLKARVSDAAGNVGPVFAKAYAIDTAAPTLSSQFPAAGATGVSINNSVILNFSEKIFANGGTVSVKVGSSPLTNTYVMTLTAGSSTGSFSTGSGTWTIAGNKLIIDPAGNFSSNQIHSFTISAGALKDAAGNVYAGVASTTSSGVYFTAGSSSDTSGPSTDVSSIQFSADSGRSSTDFNTNQPVQTISGVLSANLAAGDLVQVSPDNGTTWQYADSCATGSNQFSHTLTLPVGSNTLRVRVVDAAGNRARTGGFIPTDIVLTQSYTVDTTAPAAPGLTLGNGIADGVNKDEAIQNSGVVTVTGQSGFAITVVFQGVNGSITKVVNGNGATPVAVVLNGADLPFLGAGVVNVSASQSDVAGNASPASTASFVFDAAPPNAKVLSAVLGPDTFGAGTVGTNNDFITSSAAQTITGTLSEAPGPNEVVGVSTDNGVTWQTAITTGSTWSLNTTLSSSNTLVVRVQDLVGNFSTPFSRSYVLDSSAAPPALVLGTGVANGATAAEASQATGVVSVSAENGAAVSVVLSRSGNPNTVTRSLTGTGAPQNVVLSTADLNTLGDGLINVQATQVDIAGNTGVANTTFTLDRIAPAAPVITSPAISTNSLNQRIFGTSEAGALVTLLEGTKVLGTTTASAAGKWEAVVFLTGQGAHTITAKQRDAAGNDGPNTSAPVVITVDEIAPTLLLTKEDLQFIQLQIGIAEAHDTRLGGNAAITADFVNDGVYDVNASQAALRLVLGAGLDQQPLGLRSVEGFNNNLQPNQARFGAADRSFSPSTIGVTGVPTLTTNYDGDGSGSNPVYTPQTNVTDPSLRLISNLIADQTTSNPAAVAAAQRQQALLDPELQKTANVQALQPQYDVKNQPLVNVLNVAPNPANAPYNSFLTLFGQGFDHGLDFIDKGGSGMVMVPLLPGDPLYVQGAQTNFLVVTRATVDAQGNTTNRTTPWIDMNQAYGSHSSMQVFLREYVRTGSSTLATGRLLDGAAGGLPTWANVKAQALSKLGLVLTDTDVANCPLIVADEYGRFIPGANGYAQLVVTTGSLNGNPIVELREGTAAGLPLSGSGYAALRTGQAFLMDMAGTANPSGGKAADGDSAIGLKDASGNPIAPNQQGQYSVYDNELLESHFIAGDGRVNENQGLTAFHTMFHNEHDRLVDDYKRIALESGDLAFLNTWLHQPLTSLPASVSEIPAENWNGERLFQAARFLVEMEYQHGIFEEFARFIDPNVAADTGYQVQLDPAITREFANVVYRFGHSMLNETVDRFSPDWKNNSQGLIAAFVNPRAFVDPDNNAQTPDLTAAQAGGEILRGMTRQQGNAIDEFVTGALRNNLLGLPLDLGTINMVRARELGIPRLNDARNQFFVATNNANLAPYSNWVDFRKNLKHPESLINFVAAYGLHPELNALRDATNTDPDRINKLRTISLALINGTHINSSGKNDSADFMNAAGSFAGRRAGVDDIDFWIGGLAERAEAQVNFLGSTFGFVFEQQLQALQNGDRLYYLRRLAGNLLTQIEQNSFSAMAQRTLNVSSLPGHLFELPTYTLEVNASKQLTNLGNGKADPVGANRENATKAEIGYTVANTLRWNGGHVVLGGSEQADLLQGGRENDTLYGRGGDDVMIGGDGNDNFWGGEGNDFMFDNAGLNLMRGEAGNDVIICGSSGLSQLFGGSGKDWMLGTTGGLGNEMNGETGNDFVSASDAGSVGNGGAGDDWIEGNSNGGADTFNLDDGLGKAVNINGNAVPQAVGHDVSISRAGDDRIFGDYGNDVFIDGAGFDDYSGQAGFDWVSFARNGRDPGGTLNSGGTIDLSLAIPALRVGIQADLTDLQVEAAGGSIYRDVLVGDDRTELVGGNVYLNRNNDLGVDGLDRDLLAPFGALTNADLVLTGNLRNPVVNTHYDLIVDPGTGQLVWGPAGGISVNRALDDRLFDLPLENGGVRGLFSDYSSSATGGGSFKALIPAALQQTQEVNTRPHPQGVGINITPVIVNSVPNSGVPGFPDVQGTLTVPAYYNAGNVLTGGQGSDSIFGKAGDDVIDGDAALNVELEWRNPGNPSQVVRFTDMKAINDLQLVTGLAISPQDVYIVRELVSNPYETNSITIKANDTAVYYGRPDEYLLEGQRRVYVSSVSGTTLQTAATPVDYQEDPLTLFPINFPTNLLGGPSVQEVDLNGNPLTTTFDRNLLLNNFHPRTTIIGTPADVDGDGFIRITYAPTQAQLSDPLRLVALAPGAAVPVLQGTDYVRNIETLRFVLPNVVNPTGSPTETGTQLLNPTAYSTYTSRIGSAGETYTYSTFRDGTYVDLTGFNNGTAPLSTVMPSTLPVLPSTSNSTTPAADLNTTKALNLVKEPAPLPNPSVRLNTDTGRSNSDNISKQADITLSNLPASGYLFQWSNNADYFSPSWKALPGTASNGNLTISQQTVSSTFGLSQGVNTLYFRLIENKDGGRIGTSLPFSFTYDTTAPAAPVQTGVGIDTQPDPWSIESGSQLFYDTTATGTFTAVAQPATKPYYVLAEDAAGNRSVTAKSEFFYSLKSPLYNDGNTTTPGNNGAGTGYLVVSNYQLGEKFLMDTGSQNYFFVDNTTTADGRNGIGVFLDDGTSTKAVVGALDPRDELLALIQTPNLLARMFTKVEARNTSGAITSRTFSIDPALSKLSTFSTTTATRDALAGTTGTIDTFRLGALNQALFPTSGTTAAAFDRITNLNINEDVIDTPVSRITSIKPTVNTKAVASLTTSAISTLLTKTSFLANGAATFLFGSGTSTRTFLALNDATAGYSASTDSVLEITGYVGTLSNLNIF